LDGYVGIKVFDIQSVTGVNMKLNHFVGQTVGVGGVVEVT
jgi:hypothetical protein